MRKISFVVRWGSRVAPLCAVGLCSTPVLAQVAVRSASDVAERRAGPTRSEPVPVGYAERHGSAFVDPLGFVFFGPRVGAEAGTGHFTGALYARWFNAGLLSNRLFAKGDDELAFGYGLGLRGRYYLPEGLRGLHLGVAAEYLHSRVEDRPLRIATISSYFVPYAEVGYRLAGHRVYADASAGVGYALRSSSHVETLPGGASSSAYLVTDESSIYGTASLELGIFF